MSFSQATQSAAKTSTTSVVLQHKQDSNLNAKFDILEANILKLSKQIETLYQDASKKAAPISDQDEAFILDFEDSGMAKTSTDAEFSTSNINQLIAYQRYMIKNLASELPLAYFSAVEEIGNRFKMRVFLANKEPKITNRQSGL